jgi:hypothetical protein
MSALLSVVTAFAVVAGLLALAVVLAREVEVAAVETVGRSMPSLRLGAFRVAIVTRGEDGVAIDALLDEPCLLGPEGAPISFLLRGDGQVSLSMASVGLLERWAATDAVVEVTIPAVHPSASRVVDLRSADAELTVPLDELRS